MQTYLPTSGTVYPTRWETEFCGTVKEKDAYVKAGTKTEKIGNKTYYTTVGCAEK